MLKRVVGGVVIGAILGCLAGVAVRNPFVYMACFDVLVGGILFVLWMLVMQLIGRIFPKTFEKACRRKKDRLTVVIFFAVLFFLCVQPVINAKILSHATGVIDLLSTITTFVFVVFFGCCLLVPRKISTTVSGTVVFVLFTALLSFVSPGPPKSAESTGVDQVEKLRTLGYVNWVATEDVEKVGVVHYDPQSASKGMNLYASGHLQQADLIDMQGNIVHRWIGKEPGKVGWKHVTICDNGDLLAIVKDRLLIRLDWNSKVKWKRKMRAHHDVSIGPEGKIYALARENRLVFWHGIPVPILSDCIIVLSPDGKVEKKTHLYELLRDCFSLRAIVKIYISAMRAEFDIMHTNSIEIMDRDIAGFCKKGDWLVSIRALDLIGIVDPKNEKLTWSWGPGELDRQHHPTLLKNGNVLIFDNGWHRRYSRIVELDPLTKKIVWEYKAEVPQNFFSYHRGGSQGLPNGNTLITESEKGRVFEITKEGKVVWEFYNPEINTRKKKRAAIYRLMRISNSEIPELLMKYREQVDQDSRSRPLNSNKCGSEAQAKPNP